MSDKKSNLEKGCFRCGHKTIISWTVHNCNINVFGPKEYKDKFDRMVKKSKKENSMHWVMYCEKCGQMQWPAFKEHFKGE